MKIETQKGVTIIKEFNELILEHKGKQLNVSLAESGFELSVDHFSPIVVDKDLNEIIKDSARDMAVVFATRELWKQNPESASTKGIPTSFYKEVAERFDLWEKTKAKKEELCEISVSEELIPLFCEHPNFTDSIIDDRWNKDFDADVALFLGDNDFTVKETENKEYRIEDYIKE